MILILLGIGCCFFGTIGIVIGTLFIIGGVVVWNGSTDKSFNDATDTVRRISDAKGVTAEELYKALGKVDTPPGQALAGAQMTTAASSTPTPRVTRCSLPMLPWASPC